MPYKKGSGKSSKISIVSNHGEVQGAEAAELMNSYFANLGAIKPNGKHPNNVENHESPTSRTPEDRDLITPNLNDSKAGKDSIGELEKNELNIMVFLEQEVKLLIEKINISKSSGITFLSSKLLKDSFRVLSDKLTYLFNFSITSAIFPAQWKEALVIPIPKIGEPTEPSNYRPISLLPLPGKILEKLVHNQLSSFLEENNALSDNQFGFRKQRSTSHAVSQVLNQIYTNINRSTVTCAIYLDFSKAFNSVQHPTLLEKLKQANLGTTTLSWVASYLEGRKQRTLINNEYSTLISVKQGVPQGSVLGPLFYIIYANDITDMIEHS